MNEKTNEERTLRIAQDYWEITIWPYIEHRAPRPNTPEWAIVEDAARRLVDTFVQFPHAVTLGKAQHKLNAEEFIESDRDQSDFSRDFDLELLRKVTPDEILASYDNGLPLLWPGDVKDPAAIHKMFCEYKYQTRYTRLLPTEAEFNAHPSDNQTREYRKQQTELIKSELSRYTIEVCDLCELRWSRFAELWRKTNGNVILPARPDENRSAHSDRIELGTLIGMNDFQDVTFNGRRYDLRPRQAARFCLKLLVERKATTVDKALSFKEEIEPYVVQHAALSRSNSRTLQDYFGKKPYRQLRSGLIKNTRDRTGRYFLNV